MKKFSALLFFFITLLFSSASMAQSSDYFVGEWNIQFKDTPIGSITVLLTLERVDGKLVGKSVDAASSTETKMKSITENENSLTLNFTSAQYGDLYFTLQRTDDENVSGSLMDSFAVEGKRVALKSDYFVGDWQVTIKDTPIGTISRVLTLERIAGKLVGKILDAANSSSTPMTQITEAENSVTLYFFAEGMDLYLTLKPEGADNVTGSLMDSFAVEGKRVEK
jgi:hypothetical protein